MRCDNCQSETNEDLKFCGNCGEKIHNTQLVSQRQEVVKFHSMEELTSFLNNKAQTYRGALAKVLISQLEVLNSVQSPDLSSLTFDLLLDNLHMAIQESESKEEETEIQQKFSLLINSYVFFSQAKIEAASAANKREADALLATGANILAKSVMSVIKYAISKSTDINVTVEIANDVFGSTQGKLSFVERVVGWWRKDERIRESRQVFISTVDLLVDKLSDDRELIGPSRIIHGFVKQYAPRLIEIHITPLKNMRSDCLSSCAWRISNINDANEKVISALWWVLGVNSFVYLVLLVIWLITFLVSFFTDWYRSVGDWISGYNYIAVGSIAIYALIAMVVLIVNAIRKLIINRNTQASLVSYDNAIENELHALNEYYSGIMQYFKKH